MAVLLKAQNRIVIQGITGREGAMVAKHTLEYGTPVLAGVTPGKGGREVHGIPVYDSLRQAVADHEVDTSLVYVPPAFVLDAVAEAVENGLKLILVATENIPRQDVLKFLTLAERAGARVIGPNSVGMVSPGERMKLGAIGGDNPERVFTPGPVGVISRSGGMTAETAWMVKRAGYGVSTCVSIGGDPLIGTSPKDLLELFATDPETRAVVTFSEPGTRFEEEMAEFKAAGRFAKPLISFVAGRFTEKLPEGTVFGHAGAMISGGIGKPSQKMAKLREAGGLVAETFDEVITLLRQALG